MSCPQFIAETLAVRTAAHLMHLASTSYAEHVALGEFYEALVPLIDSYAEVYQGLEGRIKKYPAVTPDTDGESAELLEDYLAGVQAEMAEDDHSESLTNILAEIEQLTAQTLYKLKFLS